MPFRRSLSILAGALVIGACGDNPAGGTDARSSLVFTREDGTLAEVGQRYFVWCGEWEPGEVATPAVHVSNMTLAEAGWMLRAVRADVGGGATITFPNDFIFDQPEGALLFINDRDNELSTAEPESSGSITFQEVSCERGGTVRFSVDAVVGSEFGDGPTMRVTGSFRGTVGDRPF